MIIEYEADFGFPVSIISADIFTLNTSEARAIFLSRFLQVEAFVTGTMSLITSAPDVPTVLDEIDDEATIAEIAEVIYSAYDPNSVLNDATTQIIANTLIAAHPSTRAFLLYANWLTAPNVEHWRDKLVEIAVADVTEDCSGFTELPALHGAVFNWQSFSGSPFETEGSYQTNIRLSLPIGQTLGQSTRVYYEADNLGAVNGVDFILPSGYVTFPSNAGNNTVFPVAFSIVDNDIADGDRQLRIRLTNTVGASSIIGNNPNHIVTSRDNEDFYLILGSSGTNLERIDDWTWKARATAVGNTYRCALRSMNNDYERCFRLLSATFEETVPSTRFYWPCNAPGGILGTPLPDFPIHMLEYQNSQVFNVIVTIAPD